MDFMCHFGCTFDFHNFMFVLNRTKVDLTEFTTKDGEHYEQQKVKLEQSVPTESSSEWASAPVLVRR